MEPKSETLIVIAGPTAVGKTALSIKLAELLQCEIVSADSRQFYKQLNIGTAKPEKEELGRVRHHFIDVLDLDEEISAGRFEQLALEKLENLFQKRKVQILVGGSGLYIDAVCNGLDNIPEVPDNVRNELNVELKTKGLDYLLEELKREDSDYFVIVDANNPHRVIRALEVIRHTGKKFSSFRDKKPKTRAFRIIKIGLELPRDLLYDRINLRMDAMIKEGLFEEASELYIHKHLNALNTVGYKEIFDYMDDKFDREECIRLLKRNSRRYAKRQLTWFRKDESINWFDSRDFSSVRNFTYSAISE